MRNIIFDGDPGHDDVIAFLTALGRPDELNILGFTTVAGNSTVENCTKNILKVMDFVGVKIPVAVGYSSPLVKDYEAGTDFHGVTGLDGALDYPDAVSQPVDEHAVLFLKEKIESCPEKVTLVTMGPLTNAAVLLKTFPALKEKIDGIVMMGGSYTGGNVLAKSEFNIHTDPEAAKIVFDSGVHLVLCTLESANTGLLLLTEMEKLKDGGRISRLVYDILRFYSRYAVINGWDGVAIYDLATTVYLLAPEIFTFKDLRVDVELDGKYTRGMTVCDERGPKYIDPSENPKRVLISADREKFVAVLFDALHNLDELYG